MRIGSLLVGVLALEAVVPAHADESELELFKLDEESLGRSILVQVMQKF